MRLARFFALLPVLAAGGAIFVACGGSNGSNFGVDAGDGSTSSDGAPLDDGPTFMTDGGGDGSGKKLGCSGDLRNVIDENGVVVMTCPPDQGCAAGQCIPACDAAAASKGTVGCDYRVATPSFYVGIKPPCFAVFLANNWVSDVKITVQRGGQSYDATQFGRIPTAGQPATSWAAIPQTGVPAGQVAVLFMSDDPTSNNAGPLTCPVTPAIRVNNGTAVIGTGKGQAWHIVTDKPVTAYDILPFGGAKSYLPSAELLLPTTAWGTNYFGIVPIRGSSSPQWGQIVATQDGTSIDVLPSVNLPAGGGLVAAPVNVKTTFTLNAGEYLQWQDSQEMSSTVIQSTKPVVFTGGQGYQCYTSQTSSYGGCDSGHQMIPPIAAMGFEYAVAPFTTRMLSLADESIKYRFVGAVAGTALTYDPPVAGAPAALGAGQVVDFETKGAFVVKSQDDKHPFYVGQAMGGCGVTGGSRPPGGCLGDDDFVNVLPPAQFLTKYVFFTDPTYPTTNLVAVRAKTASGFKDVKLGCQSAPLTGWKPMGAGGLYEFTNVDVVRGGVGNGTCNNGPQSASSDGPFGIVVWGLDSASSYGYPAGGNVAPINTVIVPPTPK